MGVTTLGGLWVTTLTSIYIFDPLLYLKYQYKYIGMHHRAILQFMVASKLSTDKSGSSVVQHTFSLVIIFIGVTIKDVVTHF